MAKLADKPFTAGLPDFHDYKYDEPIPGFKDFNALMEAQDKKLEELMKVSDKINYKDPKASLVGAIVQFPAGDGSALYIVTKDKPLTLAYIPFGDAWQVAYITIKGCDAAYIRMMNDVDRKFRGRF